MAASAQQMGFNYIEITAEENSEKRIGEMFDNYMDGKEMKSGGVFLERLHHGTTSGRTHRVIWLWELDNFGFVEDADENERKAFWRGLGNLVEEWLLNYILLFPNEDIFLDFCKYFVLHRI